MSVQATNTIRLHRVLCTSPERVYRAFLNPEAMAKWLPTEWIHRERPPDGRQGWRHLPDVIHEFRHGKELLFRWGIP